MRAAVLHAEFAPKYKLGPGEGERVVKLGGVEWKNIKVKFGSRVWKNPQLKLEDIPKPKPGPKEVLIRIGACGICGSDVHMVETDQEGYMLYPGLTAFPAVLGHELAGVVEEVGPGVTTVKPGDLVTAEEMWWCGECLWCRGGFPNHCINLEEMGFTVNGGFAEYIVVPEKYVWSINALRERYRSDEKALEAGALVEPTSVAYNAMFVRAGGFRPGAYVVIWGAGPIGLAAIALAKAAGAARVIVFEIKPERRELAKQMGADYVLDPIELQKQGISPHEKILELTDGLGADMHVEAAGAPKAVLPEAEKSMAINCKITWIGRADVEAPIFLEFFQTRRAQIFGSQGHSGHLIFPMVIRMMAAGLIDMTKIITARFKLEEIHKAFERAKLRIDGKIQIKP